ncbi:MAG TPA: EAL domain-containing protein [Thermoanaerobaculia bacterium]|nr:EAL domain-containing protein [Thermoanaerobaculia bacterium]
MPPPAWGAALVWGFGARWWPAIFLAQCALSIRAENPPGVVLLVAVIETVVTMLFYAAMTRLRVSRELERLRDLAVFTGGAVVTTSVGGLASMAGMWVAEEHTLRSLVSDGLSFWLSDLISILVFVPLVLAWRRWPFPTRDRFFRWLAPTLLLIVLGVVLAFGGETVSAALFLLLPIVIFTAIAAGIPGAATSGAVLLLIFVGMHLGYEPTSTEGIVRIVFVGTATATGYILAVVWGEREQHARRLFALAHHDPLTGMSNRHELERSLHEAVAGGPPSAHALLYLDLDQFKLVNDTCGHIAGDRMLQELARVLERAVPEGAKLARLGGDEFACIVRNVSKDEAVAVADGIHDALSHYRFRFGSMSFAVGASIGITFFPAEGDTADAVLGRADVACYVAKEDGRHRSHVYFPRDEAMLRWHSSLHQVSRLEMAMENGSLQLWRQDICEIDGRAPAHFSEVLLRLAEGNTVRTSAEFLPVAQRFGLMDRIDRWVLDNACRHLAQCSEPELRLSVNVTGSTLNDPSFYETVAEMPERYGFDPRRLCLEVTEGVMIHRLGQAIEAMKRLRAHGFDLALDDFGAGVASFAYLQDLPVTYVKIDGRIVQRLRSDPAGEVIVGSLVRIARMRSIECIAEWVEDEETMERLRVLGVRYAQGFFVHRPAPLTAPALARHIASA